MNRSTKRNELGERIAPGIWRDANGDVHWSIPELLALVDLEDTPENRKSVTAMLRQTLLAQNSKVQIIYRETPDD